MRAEEFYENQMIVEAAGIEDSTLVISSTKMGNSVPHLDHPTRFHTLRADVDSKREKKAYEYSSGRRHAAYYTRTLNIGSNTQGRSRKKYQNEPGAIFGKPDLSSEMKPERKGTDRESQRCYSKFSACFHQCFIRFRKKFAVPASPTQVRFRQICQSW